jgi:hypothetical protein
MKAEHRHQLQTNALADRMGRLVQGMKTGPKGNAAVVWVLAILAIGTFGLWYWASGSAAGGSPVWVRLDGAHDAESLESIARNNPGTIAGRTAQFQQARLLLQRGLRGITSADRSRAAGYLADARSLFRELASACRDEPVLLQEALLATAQAEEALVGVLKTDDDDQNRGDLKKALELYRQLAENYPDSYFGKQAARRVEELSDPEKVEKFYADLNKFDDTLKK